MIPPLPPLLHHSNLPPLNPPCRTTRQHTALPPCSLCRFAVLSLHVNSKVATLARQKHLSFLYLLNASVTDAGAVLLPSPLAGCCLSPQSQPELRRNAMAPINLERWYQDIMAAGDPQSCPPPLPAKSFSTRRQGQVNSAAFLLPPELSSP